MAMAARLLTLAAATPKAGDPVLAGPASSQVAPVPHTLVRPHRREAGTRETLDTQAPQGMAVLVARQSSWARQGRAVTPARARQGKAVPLAQVKGAQRRSPSSP